LAIAGCADWRLTIEIDDLIVHDRAAQHRNPKSSIVNLDRQFRKSTIGTSQSPFVNRPNPQSAIANPHSFFPLCPVDAASPVP
jgi:hypothetical protein